MLYLLLHFFAGWEVLLWKGLFGLSLLRNYSIPFRVSDGSFTKGVIPLGINK